MDPIHPIVPVTPHILPILPSPRVGHIDRETQRDDAGRRYPERQPRHGDGSGPDEDGAGGSGPASGEPRGELPPGDEDDGFGHVDLTA
jgi:hypothetical protein